MTFNFTPYLSDDVIELRELKEKDFNELYLCASDKFIWEGHPANRYKKDVFKKWFESALSSDGALKIIEKQSGKIIGSSRYYEFNEEKREIAVGHTFLIREFWGGETNKRLKTLMFSHAFNSVDKIWLHIASSNIRSQRATEKIGAIFSHEEKKQVIDDIDKRYYYVMKKIS